MTSYVYRHYDADGVLLYVGCTDRPVKRASEHAVRSPWAKDVADSTYEEYDSREMALTVEANAIATEAPLHNVRDTTDGWRNAKATWPQLAAKRDFLESDVTAARRKLALYDDAVAILAPLMEAHPGRTVAEAVQILALTTGGQS